MPGLELTYNENNKKLKHIVKKSMCYFYVRKEVKRKGEQKVLPEQSQTHSALEIKKSEFSLRLYRSRDR